jgi:hypothetical protein
VPAERDALNFFEPFERLPPHHENQLTRALLLVLKLSPMVHAAWLARAAPTQRVHELPPATFNTQRRALRIGSDDEDQVPVVSVFLAPTKPLGEDVVLKQSDRLQVLDAVIEYGDALVMVIENKVAEASDVQARELNIDGAGVVIAEGQERQVVTWPDVIADITGIAERALAGGAERAVLEDFLGYVEDHFAELGPYRTLGLAHGNEFRTRRRLRGLLGEAAGGEARIDKWGPTVDLPELPGTASRAYLFLTDGAIELSVYPADTLSQARAFYARPAAVAALLALAVDPEWEVMPNYHFGHMEGGYAWTTTKTPVERYIKLWQEEIAETRAVKRDEWDNYWAWLVNEEIATADDRPEFDRHFKDTHRQKAIPRPGLMVVRRWDLERAEELDAQHELVTEVALALKRVTGVLSGI